MNPEGFLATDEDYEVLGKETRAIREAEETYFTLLSVKYHMPNFLVPRVES